MLTQMQAKNFKSWEDTGPIRLAPLTGFFGANSSGKSSLLQTLLLFKMTTESNDRNIVLKTAQEDLIDLGTIYDLLRHEKSAMDFSFAWNMPLENSIGFAYNSNENKEAVAAHINELLFKTRLGMKKNSIFVSSLEYHGDDFLSVIMRYIDNVDSYHLETLVDGQPTNLVSPSDFKSDMVSTLKSYGFAGYLTLTTPILNDFNFAFEQLFDRVHYLGPLREYPRRTYGWSGESPSNVGTRGEYSIAVMLANISLEIKEKVSEWLVNLGLVKSFELNQLSRTQYEVRVVQQASHESVSIADTGFGISQILPILVLCYSVPKGSILLIEQPEIHLHPSVQAGLADVFIDAIKTRGIQIIMESHSEHFLRRLQRRIAEGVFANDDTALYFCEIEGTTSVLNALEIDDGGNIRNWPTNFFGDILGDLYAMVMADTQRQISNGKS